MAKKNFEGVNTGRVYEEIEKATAKTTTKKTRQSKPAAKEPIKKESQEPGKKSPRINLAVRPDNYEFIQVMSKATGRTMTTMINDLIAAYREEHPEFMEKAADFLAFMNSGAFSGKPEGKADKK